MSRRSAINRGSTMMMRRLIYNSIAPAFLHQSHCHSTNHCNHNRLVSNRIQLKGELKSSLDSSRSRSFRWFSTNRRRHQAKHTITYSLSHDQIVSFQPKRESNGQFSQWHKIKNQDQGKERIWWWWHGKSQNISNKLAMLIAAIGSTTAIFSILFGYDKMKETLNKPSNLNFIFLLSKMAKKVSLQMDLLRQSTFSPSMNFIAYAQESIPSTSSDSSSSYKISNDPPISLTTKEKISLENLIESVKAGDKLAQFDLALLMLHGDWVPRDHAAAAELLTLSSLDGYADASYQLAMLYSKGSDQMTPNIEKATDFLHLAASQGCAKAITKVALIHLLTNRNAKDNEHLHIGFIDRLKLEQAQSLLIQAAKEYNNAEAQFYLFLLAKQGQIDVDSPREWLEVSANQGFTPSQYYLARSYRYGSGEEVNLEKSIYWYEEASKRGHAGAQVELAQFHLIGLGKSLGLAWLPKRILNPDLNVALQLLESSMTQDEPRAQYLLGFLLLEKFHNEHHQDDCQRAWTLLSDCVRQGTVHACLIHMALMILEKEPCIPQKYQDYQLAFRLMSKAALKKDTQAMTRMAIMVSEGIGIEKSSSQALEMWANAAHFGDPEAQFRLGLIYLGGELGLKKSQTIAREWFKRAMANGHDEAYQYWHATNDDTLLKAPKPSNLIDFLHKHPPLTMML